MVHIYPRSMIFYLYILQHDSNLKIVMLIPTPKHYISNIFKEPDINNLLAIVYIYTTMEWKDNINQYY